jgi:hypothetical protein
MPLQQQQQQQTQALLERGVRSAPTAVDVLHMYATPRKAGFNPEH